MLTRLPIVGLLLFLVACGGGGGSLSTTGGSTSTSGSTAGGGQTSGGSTSASTGGSGGGARLAVRLTWDAPGSATVLGACNTLTISADDGSSRISRSYTPVIGTSTYILDGLQAGLASVEVSASRGESKLASFFDYLATSANPTPVDIQLASRISKLSLYVAGASTSTLVLVKGSSVPVEFRAIDSNGTGLSLPADALSAQSLTPSVVGYGSGTITGIQLGLGQLQLSNKYGGQISAATVSVTGQGGSVIIK